MHSSEAAGCADAFLLGQVQPEAEADADAIAAGAIAD